MKKNNNGFSLVELIVVVLIMAIIAVALAPQVMKWVENSRKSTDCNNYDSVVSAVNIALASEAVMSDLAEQSGAVDLTWDKEGWDGGFESLNAAIADTLGTSWDKDLKVKRTDMTGVTMNDDGTSTTGTVSEYKITVAKNGTVKRAVSPASNDIS